MPGAAGPGHQGAASVTVSLVLGLPDGTRACLFDLDGVLTRTAEVHAAAWKATFDRFLRQRAEQRHEPFVPFDAKRDYDDYVDGKPRMEGVRSFLASRGIDLPDTEPPSGAGGDETIVRLAERKNDLVLQMIQEHGVRTYEGSVRYAEAARTAGLRCAVVSSSTNCHRVLAAANIGHLFETVVDGVVAEREHLEGKPAPDTYLAAARALGVAPRHAAVFEDALAGVEAGRAGGFGFVVGVDRVNQAEALAARGADLVVGDLGEMLDAP